MRSVFSRRRLSSLTTTYQEAINSWNLAKESKISRIAMINAELSQIKGNCELERDLYSRLRTERDALNNELGSTNLDFKFQHKYQTGKVESVEILSLKEMNNRQFNLAFGPELARHTSEYYKVFDDIFPDKWASRLVEGSLENLLNFSVTFDGDSPSRPAFGNIISPNSTTKAPKITLKLDNDRKSSFTFMLIDADVPLPAEKTLLPCPLWMNVNVPVGSNGCRLDKGREIISYTPPHPARGSGFHRFIWMALEQTDLLDEFEVQKKLAEAEWDAKNLLGRLDVVPRGFVFHRAAWDEAVSVLFRNQYIRSPLRVLKANGHDSKTEQGLSVWDVEPVYGNPISQSWEIVNRNLYKYAFM